MQEAVQQAKVLQHFVYEIGFLTPHLQMDAAISSQNEMSVVRADMEASEERLRAAHQTAIEQVQAERNAALEEQAKSFQVRVAEQEATLRLMQAELARSETALQSSTFDVQSLRARLDSATERATSIAQMKDEEIQRLRRDLASTHDAYAALSEDLQDTVRRHAQEVQALQAAHVQEGTHPVVRLPFNLRSTMMTWTAAGARAETLAPPAIAKIATPALFAWDMVRKCRPLG